MISHKYKCIFIHIPKTAGTSIEYKLGHFKKVGPGVQDHRMIMEIEPLSYFDRLEEIRENGRTFAFREVKNLISRRRRVPEQIYNTYFKFTFVRNPWARVFSWYRNVMRREEKRRKRYITDDYSFSEYLENFLDQESPLNPQLSWITARNGHIPLNFIGRFENLEQDFSYVCDVLKIEDTRLPKMIAGNNLHYAEFYDENMKNIVAKKYAEEIEFFKFEFGQ